MIKAQKRSFLSLFVEQCDISFEIVNLSNSDAITPPVFVIHAKKDPFGCCGGRKNAARKSSIKNDRY